MVWLVCVCVVGCVCVAYVGGMQCVVGRVDDGYDVYGGMCRM